MLPVQTSVHVEGVGLEGNFPYRRNRFAAARAVSDARVSLGTAVRRPETQLQTSNGRLYACNHDPSPTRMRCKWQDRAQSANALMCCLQETPNRARHVQIPVGATRVPELRPGSLSRPKNAQWCVILRFILDVSMCRLNPFDTGLSFEVRIRQC